MSDSDQPSAQPNSPTTAFSELSLRPELLGNLQTLKFDHMTPIQALSLPAMLAGKDVLAQAQTGTGKTAAFGLGLLNRLQVDAFRVQALVLCPTRELADQVAREIRSLARALHNVKVLTLCGGLPFGPQIGSLAHGAHIVVGTPGRINEHLRKGTLTLDRLQTLVLDEADRMLDMGFQDALDAILEKVPSQRQTWLFSATYPDDVQALARRVQQSPVMARIDAEIKPLQIEQHWHRVGAGEADRLHALRLLLHHHRPTSALVFCATRQETGNVMRALRDDGISALALSGDLEQKQRDQVLVRFASQSVTVLVATDVAARGLDIEALDLVVNFRLAHDPEVHVHRVGRTGRAGAVGLACTLVSEREDGQREQLADLLKAACPLSALPAASVLENPLPKPAMVTLQLDSGKRQKLRPGDILGALTRDGGLSGDQVGKITLFPEQAFVAVHRSAARQALSALATVKGKSVRVRRL